MLCMNLTGHYESLIIKKDDLQRSVEMVPNQEGANPPFSSNKTSLSPTPLLNGASPLKQ